jgi:hypothetical protein
MQRTRRSKRAASPVKAAELALIAPQVIAMRSLRMHDQLEMQRMVTEKTLAFWESMTAMGLSAMTQAWSPWMTPWQAAAAAGRILEQGMRPVHRRASANARRLRRKRR